MLTTDEKIKRLKIMYSKMRDDLKKPLQERKYLFLCNSYQAIFNDGYYESLLFTDIPEILHQKPDKKTGRVFWFNTFDTKSRLSVISKTINELKDTLK